MKMGEYIASVIIDGTRHPLRKGNTVIGKLKFCIDLENPEEGLYSWVVTLENDSEERSPGIREFLGLDLTVPVKGAVGFHTLRGDDCSVRSFFPEDFDIPDGASVSRSPTGGRSSNTTAFPYFDVEDSTGAGLVCGIGWSGQWKLEVSRSGDALRLAAGFQDCDFALEPHEKIRSVRALMYFGQGGEDRLRQKFVRLHRKYYSPVRAFDRDTFFPVAASCFDRYYWDNEPKDGGPIYFETEEAQENIIRGAAKCRYLNAFWLDACWFDGAFRTGVGNYRYAEGFPGTLRKLSDMAHRSGMRFILWFEPVRAHAGTDIYEKFHDDRTKIIPSEDGKRFLVNLGDPEVWQYQFEHISKVIEECGVDIYRQDFNINPYEYLKPLDAPDRAGIAQIRFVEGMYRLWDALLERFPGLMIDNCSSGGRLLDVETAMRAVPLWRSDMGCRPSPLAMQNEVLTLSRYLPYHQGGCFDSSPYFLRSSMTTGVGCTFAFLSGIIDPEAEETSIRAVSRPEFLVSDIAHLRDFDPGQIAAALKDALSLREYWNGDFTALTPPADDRKSIVAYTLRLPKEDRGVILIFRREEAPEHFTVKLPEIDPEREYALVFSDEDLAETEMAATGRQLSEGLPVRIGKAPGSLRIAYRPRV